LVVNVWVVFVPRFVMVTTPMMAPFSVCPNSNTGENRRSEILRKLTFRLLFMFIAILLEGPLGDRYVHGKPLKELLGRLRMDGLLFRNRDDWDVSA
jgi:hypothetical protein